MKRNRSLTDILESLTLNEKRSKKDIQIYIEHEDIFSIGKITLEKCFFSREEVILLLNNREQKLYTKFINLIKSFVYKTSNSVLNIPNWVK